MNFIKRAVGAYSAFISRRPYLVAFLVIMVSCFAFYGMQSVQVKSMEYKNMLPSDLEVIKAGDLVADSFGGMESVKIALILDPSYPNSNEKRDIRDPQVIAYIDLLSQAASQIEDVTGVSSASTVLRSANGGHLANNLHDIGSLSETLPALKQYFNKDYSISVINLQLSEDVDAENLVYELERLISEIPKVSGVIALPAGDLVTGPIVNKEIGADMAMTSNISLIGIVVLLLLLFRSIRFGLTPLAAIGVGVIWAFGYIGLMGLRLSSATSGVISMIMGIGIDFGIQVTNRFRQELGENDIEQAMENSLNSTILPMTTTTLAALIGFKAMAMGQLSLLEEMGRMMSYGITACFFAAITIVPALLVIFERFAKKRKKNKLVKNDKRNKVDDLDSLKNYMKTKVRRK